jgi:hypothetical protein
MFHIQFITDRSTVHVSNEEAWVILVFFHQLVPSWLHFLAMSPPTRKELDKHGLSVICSSQLSKVSSTAPAEAATGPREANVAQY